MIIEKKPKMLTKEQYVELKQKIVMLLNVIIAYLKVVLVN